MSGRTLAAAGAALLAGSMACGCGVSLPPEYQPKPFSLAYARKVLVGQKPAFVLINRESIRDARIGRFEARLLGQSSVCLAYDWRDRSGSYTGLNAYTVFIAPDNGTVVQVLPANGTCDINALEAFPEFNAPVAAAPKPAVRPKRP